MKMLACLILAALSASCGSIKGSYLAPEGTPDSYAIVNGEDPSMLAGLNPLAARRVIVKIVSVDGESLSKSAWSGYPATVRVAPGSHRIALQSYMRLNGKSFGESTAEHSHLFQAGKTYQITWSRNGRGTLDLGIELVLE